MPWFNKRSVQSESLDDVIHDDGGSGLMDACLNRFAEREWMIQCDAQHAVWVRSGAALYAVGLAPWMLRKRSIDSLLDEVEAKVEAAEMRLDAGVRPS